MFPDCSGLHIPEIGGLTRVAFVGNRSNPCLSPPIETRAGEPTTQVLCPQGTSLSSEVTRIFTTGKSSLLLRTIQSGNTHREGASGRTFSAAVCFEAAPPPLKVSLVRQSLHSALHLFMGEKYLPHSATD